MKTKQRKKVHKRIVVKRKVRPRMSWTKEEIEDFKYLLRRYLHSCDDNSTNWTQRVRQMNGNRFELYSRNKNGTITTTRYDLLKRCMTAHRLVQNFRRRGKHGNLSPYKWVIDSIWFYHTMTIKMKEDAVWSEANQKYEIKITFKSFHCPNALAGELR